MLREMPDQNSLPARRGVTVSDDGPARMQTQTLTFLPWTASGISFFHPVETGQNSFSTAVHHRFCSIFHNVCCLQAGTRRHQTILRETHSRSLPSGLTRSTGILFRKDKWFRHTRKAPPIYEEALSFRHRFLRSDHRYIRRAVQNERCLTQMFPVSCLDLLSRP